jgi:hypothetical protein
MQSHLCTLHAVKGHPNPLTPHPTASLTVVRSADIGRSQWITTGLKVLIRTQCSSIDRTVKVERCRWKEGRRIVEIGLRIFSVAMSRVGSSSNANLCIPSLFVSSSSHHYPATFTLRPGCLLDTLEKSEATPYRNCISTLVIPFVLLTK